MIRPVHGTGAAEVAMFGSEGDASLSEEGMEYEWPDVLSNDWRIVSAA